MSEPETATESATLRAFRKGHEALVRAFNAGDYEAASRSMREDFVQEFPRGFVQKEVRGREAWRAFYREFAEDLKGWTLEPIEYIQAGPRTFVIGMRNSGYGRLSGLVTVAEVWDVVELDDDFMAFRAREYFDRDEALAAAGLDPETES